MELAVQAKSILVDRPQQFTCLSRGIFGNILRTHQSEVVPALTLEEELTASFLQNSLDDIGIAAYERVVGIERSVFYLYSYFTIVLASLYNLGSAGQPIQYLNPTSPCREARGAGAHPGLFHSVQEHLSL